MERVIAECSIPDQHSVSLIDQCDVAPRYVVRYGKQERSFYDFPDARTEFRWCVEHAMRCNGYGD